MPLATAVEEAAVQIARRQVSAIAVFQVHPLASLRPLIAFLPPV